MNWQNMQRLYRKAKHVMKESIKRKFLRAIGTPEFVVREQPEICMIGNEKLSIENYKSLLQYSDETLIIRLITGKILIEGRKLAVRDIELGKICVEGLIKQISFIEEV